MIILIRRAGPRPGRFNVGDARLASAAAVNTSRRGDNNASCPACVPPRGSRLTYYRVENRNSSADGPETYIRPTSYRAPRSTNVRASRTVEIGAHHGLTIYRQRMRFICRHAHMRGRDGL